VDAYGHIVVGDGSAACVVAAKLAAEGYTWIFCLFDAAGEQSVGGLSGAFGALNSRMADDAGEQPGSPQRST